MKQLSYCSFLLLLGILSPLARSQDPVGACPAEREWSAIATDYEIVQAPGKLVATRSGDVQLALLLPESDRVGRLIRFRPADPELASTLIGSSDRAAGQAVVEHWQLDRGKILRIRFGKKDWLIATAAEACLQTFVGHERMRDARYIELAALAVHDFGSDEQIRVDEIAARFEERPLIMTDAGEDGRGPLWCRAGETGAWACGWSAGDFGAVTGGSCLVECPPPSFACCGPGFGSNCACITSAGNP